MTNRNEGEGASNGGEDFVVAWFAKLEAGSNERASKTEAGIKAAAIHKMALTIRQPDYLVQRYWDENKEGLGEALWSYFIFESQQKAGVEFCQQQIDEVRSKGAVAYAICVRDELSPSEAMEAYKNRQSPTRQEEFMMRFGELAAEVDREIREGGLNFTSSGAKLPFGGSGFSGQQQGDPGDDYGDDEGVGPH